MRLEIDRVDRSVVVPVDKQRSGLHGRQLGGQQLGDRPQKMRINCRDGDVVELGAVRMTGRSGWEGEET
jgi:hypothetical protein